MYKFQRVSKGPCSGAYGHPHFLRGRLDLCRHINRFEQVTLKEPQEPILKVSSESRIEPIDVFPGFERPVKETDRSLFREDKIDLPCGDFGIDFKISPTMEPTKDDPSWSLYNNTPSEILDEIIATFAPRPMQNYECFKNHCERTTFFAYLGQ